jgi:Arylsulfotransferase (ASST)
MDWKGRILWEVNHPDHNHDGIRLKNGNVLLICQKPLPVDLVPKVRGGRPGSEYDDGKMDAPYVVEMTISGQIVWEWLSWEHLDPGQDMITADQDDRDVWTVANGVSEMPDGNLLVSFRDISTVVMINRRTGAIYWKLGAPPLAGQHAPHILSNGNLLLFDNGPHRLDHSFPFSRVLEIDPATKAIVWKYQEARVSDFFSPRISNAQRLPNGNTFINEGWFGRFFEVTRDGAVVWEYVNPYFGRRQQLMINAVQRAYRYSAADIARAQSAA